MGKIAKAMPTSNLNAAKRAKNDEFYTQWHDIEMEINAYLEANPHLFRGKTVLCPCDDPEWSNFTKLLALNFQDYGIKKLISTSYAPDSKRYPTNYQPTLFEQQSPQFAPEKTATHGKLFVLDHDTNHDHRVDIDDLQWQYLQGDGDFRSAEVSALLQEADLVITNPPFSLFREFLAWLIDAHKQFAIIGNMNAITYKEVFPLIKDNKLWLGATIHSGDREFGVPDEYPLEASGWRVDENPLDCKGRRKPYTKYLRIKGVRWYTNIEHGRRHAPLQLMTMADNLKFSRHSIIREQGYPEYDNYQAIEVPYTDAIPSDYPGVMGVPISFLDKYCPEQFEIVNANDFRRDPSVPPKKHGLIKDKEARITLDAPTAENADSAERERVQDNLRAPLHPTPCSPQVLMDGTSTANAPTPASLSAAYYDMVARPALQGIKTYRRIFIRAK